MFKVKIIKQNSKQENQIIDNKSFETRKDADDFINQNNAEVLVFKTQPNKIYYELSHQ